MFHVYCLSSSLENQLGSVNRCRTVENFIIISDPYGCGWQGVTNVLILKASQHGVIGNTWGCVYVVF